MERDTVTLGSNGRLVIPAKYRRALDIEEGDELLLSFEDGELRLMSRERALRRAKELVRQYIPESTSLSDELIADRREEAARE
jgi:AbrB family looped-hinge helix DNA binding protein